MIFCAFRRAGRIPLLVVRKEGYRKARFVGSLKLVLHICLAVFLAHALLSSALFAISNARHFGVFITNYYASNYEGIEGTLRTSYL